MNNNTFVHKYIKKLINKESICVDMTLGNGNDTFFLAPLVSKVYGFDIALEAINNSKHRCKDFNNIEYILDNHINVDKYVDSANLFIFNLGYLPNSDLNSITQKDDTLIAFKKAYELLKNNGYIVITFYLGQKGGKDEYYLLDQYIKENKLNVIERYKQYRSLNEPITLIIKKSL